VDGVVFEGSASTFWDRGEFGRPTPLLESLLAPEALHRVVGNRTKLMVLLRDPVARLYSSYNHFGRIWRAKALRKHPEVVCTGAAGTEAAPGAAAAAAAAAAGAAAAAPTYCTPPTPTGFHNHVVSELAQWSMCRIDRTELECAYSTVAARTGSLHHHAFLAAGL
jgi:hypothetical protein